MGCKQGLQPTSLRLPYEQEAKVSPQLALQAHPGSRLRASWQTVLFPKTTCAKPRPPPRLNVWGSNSKVRWPECDQGSVQLEWVCAAHLQLLRARSSFAFRDELQRTAKYSEAGLPRLGAIIQELMAQPVPTFAAGHL